MVQPVRQIVKVPFEESVFYVDVVLSILASSHIYCPKLWPSSQHIVPFQNGPICLNGTAIGVQVGHRAMKLIVHSLQTLDAITMLLKLLCLTVPSQPNGLSILVMAKITFAKADKEFSDSKCSENIIEI